jgi:hypothetical protein
MMPAVILWAVMAAAAHLARLPAILWDWLWAVAAVILRARVAVVHWAVLPAVLWAAAAMILLAELSEILWVLVVILWAAKAVILQAM